MSTIQIKIQLEVASAEALAELASDIDDDITRIMEKHYYNDRVSDSYEFDITHRYEE